MQSPQENTFTNKQVSSPSIKGALPLTETVAGADTSPVAEIIFEYFFNFSGPEINQAQVGES